MKGKTNQARLFDQIMSLRPIIEIKKTKNNENISINRKEFILINGNKISLYDFKAHLDTIQKRNYLNNFCLNEISKDCENKQVLTKEELANLNNHKHNYHPNILIQCEYFFFSTKTIFDTILNIIEYVFPEKSHKGFGEIENWKDGDLMKDLIGGNLGWFITFNNRRNRLAHDTIAGISTNINYNAWERTVTYSKRNLNIRKKEEQSGEFFRLPDYFEECFLKTNKVIDNFYELLLNQRIEGESNS